jgi:hypothetical protein
MYEDSRATVDLINAAETLCRAYENWDRDAYATPTEDVEDALYECDKALEYDTPKPLLPLAVAMGQIVKVWENFVDGSDVAKAANGHPTPSIRFGKAYHAIRDHLLVYHRETQAQANRKPLESVQLLLSQGCTFENVARIYGVRRESDFSSNGVWEGDFFGFNGQVLVEKIVEAGKSPEAQERILGPEWIHPMYKQKEKASPRGLQRTERVERTPQSVRERTPGSVRERGGEGGGEVSNEEYITQLIREQFVPNQCDPQRARAVAETIKKQFGIEIHTQRVSSTWREMKKAHNAELQAEADAPLEV